LRFLEVNCFFGCIIVSTILRLKGKIPVFVKADLICKAVKLLFQAALNKDQNIRFDIATMPMLLCVRLLSSFVYAVAKGKKRLRLKPVCRM
jgi:hypothetical protein